MLISIASLVALVGVLAWATDRLRLPAFTALMAGVLLFGLVNRMTVNSVGKAFGLGFVQALETPGLLFVAAMLAARLLRPAAGGPAQALLAGSVAGLGGTANGGYALAAPLLTGGVRTALLLALALLLVQALVPPAPLAVAAGYVLAVSTAPWLAVAVPLAVLLLAGAWFWCHRAALADGTGFAGRALLVLAVPAALLIAQAVAQIPSEPLGRGGAREFWTGISRPLMLAVLVVGLAFVVARDRGTAALADTGWALPLLAIGAAGGLARVLDEAGFADLAAEALLDARLGVLAPFVAAATVKALQGHSLSAVLTASGMTEPMLGALGLDSATGRALAAAAAGLGSVAVVHVNDPLFWMVAHGAGMGTKRTLATLTLGLAALATTGAALLWIAAALLL
ncbi:MAG: hypothetical protein FJX02_00280 [Alphaproteobacteria bacterium]|nr:hypothetical protein [Alphaproteobacteria bacterium]